MTIDIKTYNDVGPRAYQAANINDLNTVLNEFSDYNKTPANNEITVMTITPIPVYKGIVNMILSHDLKTTTPQINIASTTTGPITINNGSLEFSLDNTQYLIYYIVTPKA
jgi:hypothetical protein